VLRLKFNCKERLERLQLMVRVYSNDTVVAGMLINADFAASVVNVCISLFISYIGCIDRCCWCWLLLWHPQLQLTLCWDKA